MRADLAQFLSDTGDRRHELAGEEWGNPPPATTALVVRREGEFVELPSAIDSSQLDAGIVGDATLRLAQVLRHSMLPLAWDAGCRQSHWPIASGGNSRCIYTQVRAVSSDVMLEAELEPSLQALRIVSRGPSAPGARLGTTLTLKADPGRTARRYGDFGVQLMLLEAGAAAEQIALAASAMGLDVTMRFAARSCDPNDYPLAAVDIGDGGALARLPTRARTWWTRELPSASPRAHAALAEMCREDGAPEQRCTAQPPIALFSAANRRSSGPIPAGPAHADPKALSEAMAAFGALGGADRSLELRYVEQPELMLRRLSHDGKPVGESMAAPPDVLEFVTHGARGASIIVGAALSLAGGWSAYRDAMLATGAAMHRLCLGAASAGLWARPRREIPDRALATLFPFGHHAMIQVDFGPLGPGRLYNLQ